MSGRALSYEETDALLRDARSGSREAANRLAEANLALVRSVAKRFGGRGRDPDDLIQTGSVGLLKAIEYFDPAFGVRFSTYAVPMISGEIRRSLRDGGMIRVDRRYRELALAIERLAGEAEAMGEEPPKASELAERLGVKPSEIAMALEALRPCLSLSEPVFGCENASEMEEIIPDPASMEKTACDRVMAEQLMKRLPPRERTLLRLRYYMDLTQKETAKRLGLSQVQVSRLEKRSLAKMRETAADD